MARVKQYHSLVVFEDAKGLPHSYGAKASTASEAEARAFALCQKTHARLGTTAPRLVSVKPWRAPKARKAAVPSGCVIRTAEDYNADRAINYALWLAQRDGIVLPTYGAKPRAVWSGFYSAHKQRIHRRWDDSTIKVAVYCKRVCAVEWGHKEPRYNTRKDGRRGAWLCDEFVPVARIEIPHWDFEAAPPLEETVPDAVAA